jgi:hypothetical protein
VLKTVFILLSISLTFSLVISNEQLDKFLIFLVNLVEPTL